MRAAHLNVFLVMWDFGEELLPPHQLSKQRRGLLQPLDQRFDVVVDRLLMNLQEQTDSVRIWTPASLRDSEEDSDLQDVGGGELLRPQELQDGSEVGTVAVDEVPPLRVGPQPGLSAEQLCQLGVGVLSEHAQ